MRKRKRRNWNWSEGGRCCCWFYFGGIDAFFGRTPWLRYFREWYQNQMRRIFNFVVCSTRARMHLTIDSGKDGWSGEFEMTGMDKSK